jgi:hypothetical protein
MTARARAKRRALEGEVTVVAVTAAAGSGPISHATSAPARDRHSSDRHT